LPALPAAWALTLLADQNFSRKMKTLTKNLLLGACAGMLLAGCATKGTDSCCDDGSTNCAMKTVKSVEYEYKSVRLTPRATTFEADLNAASKGGWKLLTITQDAPDVSYNFYTFERLKQ
jgi:hypothetical protein